MANGCGRLAPERPKMGEKGGSNGMHSKLSERGAPRREPSREGKEHGVHTTWSREGGPSIR